MKRARIRKLIDGQFVAEEWRLWWPFWLAIDLHNPEFTWVPGNAFYHECVGTMQRCIAALAARGHSFAEDFSANHIPIK